MNEQPQRFFGWPGWALLGEAVLLGTAQTLWWIVVYVGADWVTSLHTWRIPVHFDVEYTIPFVPAFILAYRSIDVMFLLAPFILRSRAEIRAVTLTLAAVTGIAGVGFLLLPAAPAYYVEDPGEWEPLFEWNRRIVLSYNMLPSLHVAMSLVMLDAYAQRAGRIGKVMLEAWFWMIAIATLLTHQHHWLDVFTGLLLGLAGHYLIYLKVLARYEKMPVIS